MLRKQCTINTAQGSQRLQVHVERAQSLGRNGRINCTYGTAQELVRSDKVRKIFDNPYLSDFTEGSAFFSEVDHDTAATVLGFLDGLLDTEYYCLQSKRSAQSSALVSHTGLKDKQRKHTPCVLLSLYCANQHSSLSTYSTACRCRCRSRRHHYHCTAFR